MDTGSLWAKETRRAAPALLDSPCSKSVHSAARPSAMSAPNYLPYRHFRSAARRVYSPEGSRIPGRIRLLCEPAMRRHDAAIRCLQAPETKMWDTSQYWKCAPRCEGD